MSGLAGSATSGASVWKPSSRLSPTINFSAHVARPIGHRRLRKQNIVCTSRQCGHQREPLEEKKTSHTSGLQVGQLSRQQNERSGDVDNSKLVGGNESCGEDSER